MRRKNDERRPPNCRCSGSNEERRTTTSPPPHCPNFTTTTSTKMLTTTTTSYPISRSRPLLAALTELNPFTVPKSRKTCSFRFINWWHFCVERGEGKNRRRTEEEGRKGRRRREEGEDKAAGSRPAAREVGPHPVGQQLADRPAVGRQGHARADSSLPPPRDVASPIRGRRMPGGPAVGQQQADRPVVGRLGPVGLQRADGVLFLKFFYPA